MLQSVVCMYKVSIGQRMNLKRDLLSDCLSCPACLIPRRTQLTIHAHHHGKVLVDTPRLIQALHEIKQPLIQWHAWVWYHGKVYGGWVGRGKIVEG